MKKFKKNIKIAWKNVFAEKREYAPFFAALILVQLLFGISTLVHCNSERIQQNYISEQYDYHISLRGLSTAQLYYLRNVHTEEQEIDWIFDPEFTYIESSSSSGDPRYEVRLCLLGDPEDSAAAFLEKYTDPLEEDGPYSYSESPLLAYARTRGEGNVGFLFLLLLCTFLSFLLLTVLYRIKLNHYKFTYGIYLSFGADFKRLLTTAFSEMMVITTVTLLPSMALTYLIGALLYAPAGGLSGFYILPFLLLIAGSALSSLLSVILPVLLLSKGTPVKLLLSEDNSGIASSPRHSSRIFKKRSILAVEGLALFRFRKYFAGLLFSAVFFGVIFVSGAYLADAKKQMETQPIPRYSFDFTSSSYFAEDLLETLLAQEGVRAVTRENSLQGLNLLLPSERLTFHNDFDDYPRKSAYKSSTRVKCTAADAYAVSLVDSFYGYSYTGDLSLLQSDPARYVVVSDSADNRKATKIQPGEKLCVAVDRFATDLFTVDGVSATFDYTYREFTVAAVISGMPSDENIELFFEPETFIEVTGAKSGNSGSAAVYLEEALSDEKLKEIDGIMSGIANKYRNVKLQISDDKGEKLIAERRNSVGFYLLLAGLLFLVCPIILFFSQSLFYSKRKLEFDIFRAVGTVTKDVKRMHVFDGAVMALLAGILYALLSFGAVVLCSDILNRGWLQTMLWGMPGSQRFMATVPLWAYFSGLLLTMSIAFMASIFPYVFYKRKMDSQISLDFSKESI